MRYADYLLRAQLRSDRSILFWRTDIFADCFSHWMCWNTQFPLGNEKNGYAEATIYACDRDLQLLARNCELSNPEAVKEWIASQNLTSTRKWSYVKEYSRYAEFCGISFWKTKYKIVEKLPSFRLKMRSWLSLRAVKAFENQFCSVDSMKQE